MRGTYHFEDNEELSYWMDFVEPALKALESGEAYEIDYSSVDISPCLLGQVLEALGYEEDYGVFEKETLYMYYSSVVTLKRLCIIADVEIFGLTLYVCEDELKDEEEYNAYYYSELQ